MAGDTGEIQWYSPDPRGIIPLEEAQFKLPRGFRRALKKHAFECRINTEFEQVIRACALRREEETWINEEIIQAYIQLHQSGHAMSVETWLNDKLVGGLYGVALGGAFFGESMFHNVTDASKFALLQLVMRLRDKGFSLLDTQWTTPHLETFGAIEISRDEYLDRLEIALASETSF